MLVDDPEQPNEYVEMIVAAATQLFSEKGYRGTTMRDLGQALGIHAGSIYVHIKSKEDVLFEICNGLSARHQRDVAEVDALEVEPVEKLRELCHRLMGLIAENRAAATVYFHEWRNLDQTRQRQIVEKRDAFEATLRRLISECTADGSFRRLDVKLAGISLVSIFNWTYQWYSPDGPQTADEIAEVVFDFLVHGFAASRSEGIRVPGNIDAVDQIRRLGELARDGLITNDEFEGKKSELLQRI
jgi:TetR/AcrR family transcriptional regulator, cholesterol catabolism regulator